MSLRDELFFTVRKITQWMKYLWALSFTAHIEGLFLRRKTSRTLLPKRKVTVKCKTCEGHGSVFGYNSSGRPATLPCAKCNTTGTITEEI